ncbi:MAG: formylglycine-generating enzyme family protein [Candidatus Schekmanbacteria bacterium]|nr:formylglycine-generating enzyme family protein [Candidatus Schekmanbacteria bacterium]
MLLLCLGNPGETLAALEVVITSAESTDAGIQLAWTVDSAVTVSTIALEKSVGEPFVPVGTTVSLILLVVVSLIFFSLSRKTSKTAYVGLILFGIVTLAYAAEVIPLSPSDRDYTDAAVQTGQTYYYRMNVNNGTYISSQVSVVYGAATPTSTPTVAATPTPTPGQPVGDEVLVPAGEFQMGCDDAQNGQWSCDSDEFPVHAVLLDAFYIDAYEVTVAQYKTCVTAGSCAAANTVGTCIYNASGKEQHPINCVDYNQATAYCAWAGKRLPTEAEWEKAARGTDQRWFPWGNTDPDCTYANASYCVDATLPVGSYPKGVSPYGANDMAGNVWEWVSDWYGSGYYAQSPYQNPTGPASGSYRVNRGGGWDSDVARYVRAANRLNGTPSDQDDSLGFRCGRSAP